jgi:hypothetical protein
MVSSNSLVDARVDANSHAEDYLRSRAESAKYDPEDFDSLSNKFISKLVIRAN